LIDTHAHLADDKILPQISDVLTRAKENGVCSVICMCDSEEEYSLATSQVLPPANERGIRIRFALGAHPHNAGKTVLSELDSFVSTHVKDTDVVAIGEIGLDYHYLLSPAAIQESVFLHQLNLAQQHNLPVIIHSRDAMEPTLSVLKKCSAVRGVFHCFSGDLNAMEQVLGLGFYISIPGTVTFKVKHGKHSDVVDVAQAAPLDRLVVETDCPYLAPVPHRGEVNEPSFVKHTLEFIAGLRKMDPHELDEVTTQNAERLFSRAG